jgi:hypothetical protein
MVLKILIDESATMGASARGEVLTFRGGTGWEEL